MRLENLTPEDWRILIVAWSAIAFAAWTAGLVWHAVKAERQNQK